MEIDIFSLRFLTILRCLRQTSACCGFQLKDLKSQKCEENIRIKKSLCRSIAVFYEKWDQYFATVHELKMTLRDNKGRQKEGEFDSVRAVDVGLNACQGGTKTELCLFSVRASKKKKGFCMWTKGSDDEAYLSHW